MPVAAATPITDVTPRATEPAGSPVRTLCLLLTGLAAGAGGTHWLEGRLSHHTVHAHLAVRTTVVSADRGGKLVRYEAVEGDRVDCGSPLFVVADAEFQTRTQNATLLVDSIGQELKQAEAQAALEQAELEQTLDASICRAQLDSAEYLKQKFDHELTRTMLKSALDGRGSELVLFDGAAANSHDAFAKDLVLSSRVPKLDRMVTMLQLEQASNQAEVSAAQVEICEDRIHSLQRMRASLPVQLRESCGVSLISLRLQHAQAELDRLTSLQAETEIDSPAAGQVGLYHKRPGEELRAGDAIVELLDESKRYLVAEVPSRRVHEFPPGRIVTLVFPGEQERQGKVVHIAPQAEPRDVSTRAQDPIVAVEIEPCGQVWPSGPIGTRVEVTAPDLR